ncbi:hypothetical protein CC80DRAFT_588971 [Byssothecium circinans]|uniref:Sialidase domain-containing protein n=1 Tax=Byssothecium circinans TaxID=147558 RepID=A0A6A5UFC0_9PLEO|nr:hypothetical protein CC80DRAFT_588971 [Byssothecium circinans]
MHLADGSLLGTYTHWEGSNNTIVTVCSTNNGASWDPLGIVATEVTATRDLDNPYVHQMPNRDILAAFRNHDLGNGRDQKPTYHRITFCTSNDKGKTWRYFSTPIEMPAGPVFTGKDTNARDGMLGVARIADRSPTKIAIFESRDINVSPTHFTVWVVRTTIDGKTWEPKRYPVFTPSGSQAGAPQVIRVGTKLVASFGTNENGGKWPQGAMAVMVSTDGGLSWKDKTIVHANPSMWAGMIALDGKSFLALYETG